MTVELADAGACGAYSPAFPDDDCDGDGEDASAAVAGVLATLSVPSTPEGSLDAFCLPDADVSWPAGVGALLSAEASAVAGTSGSGDGDGAFGGLGGRGDGGAGGCTTASLAALRSAAPAREMSAMRPPLVGAMACAKRLPES